MNLQPSQFSFAQASKPNDPVSQRVDGLAEMDVLFDDWLAGSVQSKTGQRARTQADSPFGMIEDGENQQSIRGQHLDQVENEVDSAESALPTASTDSRSVGPKERLPQSNDQVNREVGQGSERGPIGNTEDKQPPRLEGDRVGRADADGVQGDRIKKTAALASAAQRSDGVATGDHARPASSSTPAGQIARLLVGAQANNGREGIKAVGSVEAAPASQPRQAERHQAAFTRPTPTRQANHQTPQSPQLAAGEEATFERIIKNMRLKASERTSTARMWLDPPDLGKMTVNVRLEGDGISVDVLAENREARELLYDRVSRLRSALLEHGLDIQRFEVALESDVSREHQAGGENLLPSHDNSAGGHARGGHRGGMSVHREPQMPEDQMHEADGPSDIESSFVAERRIDVKA